MTDLATILAKRDRIYAEADAEYRRNGDSPYWRDLNSQIGPLLDAFERVTGRFWWKEWSKDGVELPCFCSA